MTHDSIQLAVDDLAEHLRRSVVINDPGIHMLYASVHFGDEDPVRVQAILNRVAGARAIGYILAQGVSTWSAAGMIPANPALGMKARVCVPIRWEGSLLGQLMVMDADESVTAAELTTIERTVSQVSAVMAVNADHAGRRAVQEQTVLDLVGPESSLRRTAIRDLAPHRSEDFAFVTAVEFGVTGATRPGDAAHAAAAIRAVLAMGHRKAGTTDLVAARGDTGLLVVGSRTPVDTEDLHQHVARLRDRLADLSSGRFGCTAGIGQPVDGLELAHRSALHAHIARRAAAGILPAPVIAWSDLGPLGALLCIPPEHLSEDLLPDEVRRLLAAHPTEELIRTLRAYLDSGGNGPSAAAVLHVHRTTLYYRLGRIADLTGLDLHDGRTRLSLHLGLTMLDILNSEGHA